MNKRPVNALPHPAVRTGLRPLLRVPCFPPNVDSASGEGWLLARPQAPEAEIGGPHLGASCDFRHLVWHRAGMILGRLLLLQSLEEPAGWDPPYTNSPQFSGQRASASVPQGSPEPGGDMVVPQPAVQAHV